MILLIFQFIATVKMLEIMYVHFDSLYSCTRS